MWKTLLVSKQLEYGNTMHSRWGWIMYFWLTKCKKVDGNNGRDGLKLSQVTPVNLVEVVPIRWDWRSRRNLLKYLNCQSTTLNRRKIAPSTSWWTLHRGRDLAFTHIQTHNHIYPVVSAAYLWFIAATLCTLIASCTVLLEQYATLRPVYWGWLSVFTWHIACQHGICQVHSILSFCTFVTRDLSQDG